MRRLRGIRHREMRDGFVKFALQRPYTPVTLMHPPHVSARGPRCGRRGSQSPVVGPEARSAAITAAAPRRNANGVGLHPRVTLGRPFGETMSALCNQNVDRIGAACRRFPFGTGAESHFVSPLDADRAPAHRGGYDETISLSSFANHLCLATGPNAGVRVPLNPRILPKRDAPEAMRCFLSIARNPGLFVGRMSHGQAIPINSHRRLSRLRWR